MVRLLVLLFLKNGRRGRVRTHSPLIKRGLLEAFRYESMLRQTGIKLSKRKTIGMHGSPWSIETARTEAERLLMIVRQGLDPVEEQCEAKRKEKALNVSTSISSHIGRTPGRRQCARLKMS